jgi:hypothetical protein
MLGRDGTVVCAHCKADAGTTVCVACDLAVCADCVDDWKACSVPRPRHLRLERGQSLVAVDAAGRLGVVTRRLRRIQILDLQRDAWRPLRWKPPRGLADAVITTRGHLAGCPILGSSTLGLEVHDLFTGQAIWGEGLGNEPPFVSADERFLWAESSSEQIHLLDLEQRRAQRLKPLASEVIQASALLDDGRRWLVGTFGRIDLWDAETERTMASGAVDGDCLWIAAAGDRAVVHARTTDRSTLTGIDLSGDQLATRVLWTGQPSWTELAVASDPLRIRQLRCFDLSPDGSLVCFGWHGNRVLAVRTDGGAATPLPEHHHPLTTLRLCDRGRLLITADSSGLVVLRPVLGDRIVTEGAVTRPGARPAIPIDAPADRACAHCRTAGADALGELPCPTCNLLVCRRCLPDWHGCPHARARRLRLGLGARLRATDGTGTLGLVAGPLGGQRLVDLRTGLPQPAADLPRRGADQHLTRDGRLLTLEAQPGGGGALVARRASDPGSEIIYAWRFAGAHRLGVSDDDQYAWLHRRGGHIVLVDLASHRSWSVPVPPRGRVHACFDGPNRRLAIAAGGDLAIHVLEPDGLRRAGLLPYGGRFEWLHLVGDHGAGIVHRPGQAPLLMTWRLEGETPRAAIPDFARVVLPAVAAANARHIAAATHDNRIVIHDRHTETTQTCRGHTDTISYLRFADDGVLIAGDDDNRVWLRPHRDGRFIDDRIILP